MTYPYSVVNIEIVARALSDHSGCVDCSAMSVI